MGLGEGEGVGRMSEQVAGRGSGCWERDEGGDERLWRRGGGGRGGDVSTGGRQVGGGGGGKGGGATTLQTKRPEQAASVDPSFGDCSGRDREICKVMEKRKRWGASPAVRFMGQGDKTARACTCAAVLVPLQRIFGFRRHSSPPGCGGNRRGRKRVCHAHVRHH